MFAGGGATVEDAKIAGLIEESGRAAILILNKKDMVARSQIDSRIDATKETLAFLSWAPILLTSAVTGAGVSGIPLAAQKVFEQASRRIPTGEVRTVLGRVDTPGFQEVQGDSGLEQPCLREPEGIRCHGGWLYVADTGNHALRKVDLARGSLRTVVGDPRETQTRWGLLRDGIPGPCGQEYATVGSPTALVVGLGDLPGFGATTLVCADSVLARLNDRSESRDVPSVTDLECLPAKAGEPCLVRFRVLTRDHQGRATERSLKVQVGFFEPDGTRVDFWQSKAASAEPLAVQGTFRKAGTGRLVIRSVTEEGVSAGAETSVQVGSLD